jgi:putative alpha-1,2-mannosidase
VIYNTRRFRSSREAWGKNIIFALSFKTKKDEVVTVKTAISGISTAGAALNMQELNGKTFDVVKQEAEAKWEKELSKYQITGTEKQKETFYTSAYHAALCPFRL